MNAEILFCLEVKNKTWIVKTMKHTIEKKNNRHIDALGPTSGLPHVGSGYLPHIPSKEAS
jgi:hypothetical protein